MFTIEEFTQIYNAFISGHGISCKCTEYCCKQRTCAICPLYYVSSANMFLFMLNNTPDYPHRTRLYLETENELQKIAYYDEKFNSWEIEYTCKL